MLLRQQVKSITHVIELLSFVQDGARMHRYSASESLRRGKTSDGLTYVPGNLKDEKVVITLITRSHVSIPECCSALDRLKNGRPV
jgi:hypothetical protein